MSLHYGFRTVQEGTGAAKNTKVPSVAQQPNFRSTLVQKLDDTNLFDGDNLGASVAIDGSTIAVGVLFGSASNFLPPFGTGRVTVFTKPSSSWSSQAQIHPANYPNTVPAYDFESDGIRSLALDGDTLIFGLPFADAVGDNAGAAQIWVRSGSTWSVQQTLPGPVVGTTGLCFGTSVAVNGDLAIVGADSSLNPSELGGAYVYTRNGGVWTEQTILRGDDVTTGFRMGTTVAIDDLGTTVFAGCPDLNAVYVFTGTGSVWAQIQKLEPPGAITGFGNKYDSGPGIDIDGDTAIIGADGAAFIYTRTDGVWSLQDTLEPGDGFPIGTFGGSVGIAGDIAIVGSPTWADPSDPTTIGQVYVFKRTENSWSQVLQFGPQTDLANDNARFGSSVAIKENYDSHTIVVGAPLEDVSLGPNSSLNNVGRAYIHELVALGVEPPEVIGTAEYPAGSHSFTVPAGVTEISVGLLGAGGGGGSSGSGLNPLDGGATTMTYGSFTMTAGGGTRGFNSFSGQPGVAGGTTTFANAPTGVTPVGINGGNSPTRVESFIAGGGGGAARLNGTTGVGGATFQWGGEGGAGSVLNSYPGAGEPGGAGSDVVEAKGGDGGAAGAGGGGGRDGIGGAGGAIIYANGIQVNPGDVINLVVGAGGRGENFGTTSRRGGNGSDGIARILWGSTKSYPTASADVPADSGGTPTYAIFQQQNNVDEGSSISFAVITTNVPDGTTLFYSVTNATDFSSPTNSFSIFNNSGSFSVTPDADLTTEGSETFQVRVRTGSPNGPDVAISPPITINDTSQTPTYSVTPASNNVNEGASLTLNVTTSDVSDGTQLYWTITNSGDFGTSSGGFTVNSNAGSFVVTPTSDFTTEGSETFTASIRTGSTTGTIVATSASITINDTSTTPQPAETFLAPIVSQSLSEDYIHFLNSSGTVVGTVPMGGLVLQGPGYYRYQDYYYVFHGYNTRAWSKIDIQTFTIVATGNLNSNYGRGKFSPISDSELIRVSSADNRFYIFDMATGIETSTSYTAGSSQGIAQTHGTLTFYNILSGGVDNVSNQIWWSSARQTSSPNPAEANYATFDPVAKTLSNFLSVFDGANYSRCHAQTLTSDYGLMWIFDSRLHRVTESTSSYLEISPQSFSGNTNLGAVTTFSYRAPDSYGKGGGQGGASATGGVYGTWGAYEPSGYSADPHTFKMCYFDPLISTTPTATELFTFIGGGSYVYNAPEVVTLPLNEAGYVFFAWFDLSSNFYTIKSAIFNGTTQIGVTNTTTLPSAQATGFTSARLSPSTNCYNGPVLPGSSTS